MLDIYLQVDCATWHVSNPAFAYFIVSVSRDISTNFCICLLYR